MSHLSYVITYDNIFCVLQLTAGIGISIFYYGSLWLTVRTISLVRRPKSLMLGSFIGRTIIILSALCLIIKTMDGRWERLMACMLGFLVMRIYLVRYCSGHLMLSIKGK